MLYAAGRLNHMCRFYRNRSSKTIGSIWSKFEEVKRWYDGYQIEISVYNPNAVVNLMLEGEFQSYWSEPHPTGDCSADPNMGFFDGLEKPYQKCFSGDHVQLMLPLFRTIPLASSIQTMC